MTTRPPLGATAVSAERWREIDRIFSAALDEPDSSRAAFVDRQCAGDAALRAWVLRLLAADGEAEKLFGEAATDFAVPILLDAPSLTDDADDNALPAGERVGPYRVIR